MLTLRDASRLAEHQLRAVERLIPLLETHGGALLADEPGLGKSFVAAEVARRCRDREIEAIVPASLVGQWKDTFRMFGVRGRVMTHAALLSADDSLARRLLIVDEAHAFRNPNTRRFAALAARSVGAQLLLVTATPVCNGPADLGALLRLIVADDALMARGIPSIDVAFANRDRQSLAVIVSELVVRRDRGVLPPALAFGDLDRRVVWTTGCPEDVDAKIDAMEFPLVSGAPLVRDFLKRRLESSEAALLESLRRQRRFYERALECLASGRALPKRDYRQAFAHEEDAAVFQTILFWELFVPEGQSIDPASIHRAVRQIDDLSAAVHALPRGKERLLVDVCAEIGDPILLFTGWTATARSLDALLSKSKRTALVTGRERTTSASIDAFRGGAVDVLISTDVGAEGLNLQRAGVVIHYDLPWNPVRLDQRNGRAHRIGQRRPTVRAIYFLPERHRGRVLQTVAQKNRTRRRLLDQPSKGAAPIRPSTLRPRVAAGAAVVALAAAAERTGWRLPLALQRRHRAGIEAMLSALAGQTFEEQSLRELEGILERFAPL